MEILADGEGALTLWAVKERLSDILRQMGDQSDPAQCRVLYQPSFGLCPGQSRTKSRVFDFVIMAERRLYLGHSTGDGDGQARPQGGRLSLEPSRALCHQAFAFYVSEWAFGSYANWQEFRFQAQPKLKRIGIEKPIPEENTLLAQGLKAILALVSARYADPPEVRSVLLYLHRGTSAVEHPRSAGPDLTLITLDCSEAVLDQFVRLAV